MPTPNIISALLCVTLTPDKRNHECDESCPYFRPESYAGIDGTVIHDGWCDIDQINKDAVAHIIELEAHIEELENER